MTMIKIKILDFVNKIQVYELTSQNIYRVPGERIALRTKAVALELQVFGFDESVSYTHLNIINDIL